MTKPKWPIADPDEPTPIYDQVVKAKKTKKKGSK